MKNFVRRSIFSMLLLLPFVTQGVMAQSVADRVVHLENGVSSKAAVLNSATYQNYLDMLFANKQCTQLKAAYDTQAELTASSAYQNLPAELRDMAMKVCTGNWAETNRNNSEISWSSAAARRFRVQSYEPHSVTEEVCGLVGTKYYSNMNNPTGIYADNSDVLYIMVGSAVPEGASLYITSLTDASEGYLTDFASANKIQLKQGLNMISVTGNGNLQYILYGVNSQDDAYPLTNYQPIEIQIAGGSINGMYELGKDSDIYEELKANAAKSNITYFNVLGEKYAFHTSKVNVFKGGSDGSLTKALQAWDEIMLTQHLVMGIKTGAGDYTDPLDLHTQIADYSRKVNNRVLVHSKASIGYYIQLPYCIQFGHGESWLVGDNMEQTGQIWGPAHETGHANQTPINMIGTTEISTNLFSNVAVFYQDYIKSRGGSIADNNAEHMNGTAWHFRDSNTRMRMYYQLWLYYHAAGRNKNFYPELFRLLRNNPMSFHPVSASSSVNYTSTESLRFYQYACQAAGEDLTPFFEAWGFFKPFSETIIEDYSQYKIASTQGHIDAAKSAVAALGYPKNYSILFIEDRIGEVKNALGEIKSGSDGETNTGDRGQYSDYKTGSDPEGEYTYLVQGNRILMFSGSGNGAGYVISDASGNIIAFSNCDEFEVSDAIANNLKNGTYRLTAYGTTVGSSATVVNIENSSSVDAQKLVLGALLDRSKAILDLTDATNTKIGYYKSSYVTSLQNAYDEAKAIYESATPNSAAYATQIDNLNKEYDILMAKGDYAKVGVVNGSIYTMKNRGEFENNSQVKVTLSMALNGSDVDGRETANVETQRWIFEATGTTGYYYIKNKSKGVYVGKMTQSSTQVTATETTTANAGTYRVVIKEPGLVALVDENDRALHIDAYQNVVGWTEDATNSQWYMTAVELSELGKAKDELDALIGETSWAINEMASANIATGAVSYLKDPYGTTLVDGVYLDKAKIGTACQAVRSAQVVSNNTSSTAADYAAAYEALLDDYYYLMSYYNTATGVNLDVEREALQTAIDAVQSYLNDMNGGSGESEVELTASAGQPGYVSSNAEQNAGNGSTDGIGIIGLVDNSSSSYFHSRWDGTVVNEPHYIQVDLGAGNELANFKFNYSTRDVPHAIPTEIVISGSTDGVSFTPIKTLNKELPGGKFYTPTADYSLNSNYATATKSDRYFGSVGLSSSAYGSQTATLSSQSKVYNDLTSTTFKAAPGETLTATFNGDNCWMNGFVYIDEDNNGFTAGVNGYTPTGDLKTYSFYSGNDYSDESGKNSAGSSITGNSRNVLNPPTFKAPTTPGLYRMRYKMDWNSIDPKGDVISTNGTLLDNKGYIIDVLLEVRDKVSGTQTYESDVISTGAFYRYLRFTVTESACYEHNNCNTKYGGYYFFALTNFGLTRIDDNSTEDTWVSEELKNSAQNEINDAQNVHDNAKTAIELVRETEAMEALLANLKKAQQSTLPVKLTTNPATPYLYQVEVKEVNGESDKVWQYDTSASSYAYYTGEHNFVSHATSEPSNTNQAWYFMKGTETGQVYIYPYNAGGKLLAVDQTMYDVPNANGRIYSYAKDDISNYVQEWTFVDCGDGTYNIRPAISGTNYYVAMCAQLPGTYKLGFKYNGSDANAKFIFNSVKPTASAAWNELNNYVNAHPEVPGSTQLFATSLASANAYNTLRREAVALLETAAADDVLTEMYNNLVAAHAAITANQPSAEKLYYIRSASSDPSYKDVYVYNASKSLKWTDTAADDNSAVWTIIPQGGNQYKIRSYSDATQYWRNSDFNTIEGWSDCATTTTFDDILNIELISNTNGQINIYYDADSGDAAYNVAAGNKMVQTRNTKGTAGNTAAFYIEELPSDELSDLKSYQLSMTHWGYAGLYLDFTTVLPETMEAYVITEEEFDNVETEGSTVTATVVLRRLDCPNRVLPANTGVILKSNVDLEEGTIIYHDFEPTDKAYGGNAELVSANKLKGSAEETYVINSTNPSDYNYYNNLDFYVFGVKNGKVGLYKAPEKYYKSGSSFVVDNNWEYNDANKKLNNYIKCSANKIYYQTAQGALQGASGSSRLKFRIAGPDDEFVTDIEEVETETQQNQPEAIYDLQGRRVERITAPGLYIVNGKKHYVKAAKF